MRWRVLGPRESHCGPCPPATPPMLPVRCLLLLARTKKTLYYPPWPLAFPVSVGLATITLSPDSSTGPCHPAGTSLVLPCACCCRAWRLLHPCGAHPDPGWAVEGNPRIRDSTCRLPRTGCGARAGWRPGAPAAIVPARDPTLLGAASAWPPPPPPKETIEKKYVQACTAACGPRATRPTSASSCATSLPWLQGCSRST